MGKMSRILFDLAGDAREEHRKQCAMGILYF